MSDSRARIRIVHVLDNLKTGGTELNAVRTAERLDPDRFEVRFLVLQPDGPLRARLDAARIPVTGIPVKGLASASAWQRAREIRELVRRENIDVVHAHDPYANFLAAPAVRLGGRSRVIASHRWWQNVHAPRVRMANRLAYRFAHRVLANSRAVGELVVGEEGVPRSKLVVIPNFVDDGAFAPMSANRRAELRARVGLRDDAVAIGIVANLYPVKDHATVIRALARLAPRWPELRLVLVGEGDQRPVLEELARSLGVSERVLMPGRIAHEPGFPSIFEIAALTSKEEGFPNYVVEAMAAGLPVVATRVGGVPDAVLPGDTGYMADVGDDETLASSLDRLLGDRSLRERMGKAGAQRAKSEWHVDVVMQSLMGLYQALASEKKG
jgi:glycosyltransferase involved in cell wall biosynthesis